MFCYDQSSFWKNLLIRFLNFHDIYPEIKVLKKYNNGNHTKHIRNNFENNFHQKNSEHSNLSNPIAI